MEKKTKNNLKLLFIVIFFGFLIWSSYDLMKYPNQQPIQMGFALVYLVGLIGAIGKRIYSVKIITDDNKNSSKRMYKHFMFVTTILYLVFGVFSSFIFILGDESIRSTFFSSLWLMLLIFCFQIIPLLIFSYQLKESVSEKTMINTFIFSYFFISLIFGWSSAYLAHDILKIPAQQDLFIISYGVLILPIIFIIYFDKKFNYIHFF